MLNAKTPSNRREGFWRSSMEPDLPMPVPDPNWTGGPDLLAALAIVERRATPHRFRGVSRCRICDRGNGNTTFELDGWEWPSGLAHYVRDHGVRPSDDFVAFVLNRAGGVATARVEPTVAEAAAPAEPVPLIPVDDAQTSAALRLDTPLNRARAQFSHACGRIEQAGQQRRPAGIIEIRRMEFEAVAAIAKALGVEIPSA